MEVSSEVSRLHIHSITLSSHLHFISISSSSHFLHPYQFHFVPSDLSPLLLDHNACIIVARNIASLFGQSKVASCDLNYPSSSCVFVRKSCHQLDPPRPLMSLDHYAQILAPSQACFGPAKFHIMPPPRFYFLIVLCCLFLNQPQLLPHVDCIIMPLDDHVHACMYGLTSAIELHPLYTSMRSCVADERKS